MAENGFRFLELRKRCKLTQFELSDILDINRNRIQQLERSVKAVPRMEEIKKYCKFFQTSSDYILGIRNTTPIDMNMEVVHEMTGLDETAITTLQCFKNSRHMAILNFVLRDYADFLDLINGVDLCLHNDYTTPLYYDEERNQYIEFDTNLSGLNSAEHSVILGKKIVGEKEDLGWNTLEIPTDALLESHALTQIHAAMMNLRNKYREEHTELG